MQLNLKILIGTQLFSQFSPKVFHLKYNIEKIIDLKI